MIGETVLGVSCAYCGEHLSRYNERTLLRDIVPPDEVARCTEFECLMCHRVNIISVETRVRAMTRKAAIGSSGDAP
jgi:hypothetical protein